MVECPNHDSIPKSRMIAFHDEDVEDEGLNVGLAMPADPRR